MGLDRVDAEEDLVGDLLVGRRRREALAVAGGTTESDENAMLGIGQLHLTGTNTAMICSYPWRLK